MPLRVRTLNIENHWDQLDDPMEGLDVAACPSALADMVPHAFARMDPPSEDEDHIDPLLRTSSPTPSTPRFASVALHTTSLGVNSPPSISIILASQSSVAASSALVGATSLAPVASNPFSNISNRPTMNSPIVSSSVDFTVPNQPAAAVKKIATHHATPLEPVIRRSSRQGSRTSTASTASTGSKGQANARTQRKSKSTKVRLDKLFLRMS